MLTYADVCSSAEHCLSALFQLASLGQGAGGGGQYGWGRSGRSDGEEEEEEEVGGGRGSLRSLASVLIAQALL
jgi:hypothetical protein